VPRLWPGATIVCLGGGPSLTREDVAHCEGRARVIAINDAYLLAPWADVLYACDARWWRWHQGVPGFAGLKYGLERECRHFKGVQVLEQTGIEGLEAAPTGLRTGKNSGYQAINLAVHLGAARVVLLGYDMQRTGGREHWFGNHPNGSRSPYDAFARRFASLVQPLRALGVSVVNCSRHTALTAFPRQPLLEVLP